jgi:hypothetical protein
MNISPKHPSYREKEVRIYNVSLIIDLLFRLFEMAECGFA